MENNYMQKTAALRFYTQAFNIGKIFHEEHFLNKSCY